MDGAIAELQKTQQGAGSEAEGVRSGTSSVISGDCHKVNQRDSQRKRCLNRHDRDTENDPRSQKLAPQICLRAGRRHFHC